MKTLNQFSSPVIIAILATCLFSCRHKEGPPGIIPKMLLQGFESDGPVSGAKIDISDFRTNQFLATTITNGEKDGSGLFNAELSDIAIGTILEVKAQQGTDTGWLGEDDEANSAAFDMHLLVEVRSRLEKVFITPYNAVLAELLRSGMSLEGALAAANSRVGLSADTDMIRADPRTDKNANRAAVLFGRLVRVTDELVTTKDPSEVFVAIGEKMNEEGASAEPWADISASTIDLSDVPLIAITEKMPNVTQFDQRKIEKTESKLLELLGAVIESTDPLSEVSADSKKITETTAADASLFTVTALINDAPVADTIDLAHVDEVATAARSVVESILSDSENDTELRDNAGLLSGDTLKVLARNISENPQAASENPANVASLASAAKDFIVAAKTGDASKDQVIIEMASGITKNADVSSSTELSQSLSTFVNSDFQAAAEQLANDVQNLVRDATSEIEANATRKALAEMIATKAVADVQNGSFSLDSVQAETTNNALLVAVARDVGKKMVDAADSIEKSGSETTSAAYKEAVASVIAATAQNSALTNSFKKPDYSFTSDEKESIATLSDYVQTTALSDLNSGSKASSVLSVLNASATAAAGSGSVSVSTVESIKNNLDTMVGNSTKTAAQVAATAVKSISTSCAGAATCNVTAVVENLKNTSASSSASGSSGGSTSGSGGAASTSSTTSTTLAASHSITFDANGGTGSMSPQSITQGSSANLTSNSLTRTGFTFAGWATSAGGSVAYANGASYTMGSANVTLYAKWTGAPYTITFNAGAGGTGTMSTQSIVGGETANLNTFTFLAPSGKAFSGWSTTSNGSVLYANRAAYTMGSADVTLHAIWATAPAVTAANVRSYFAAASEHNGKLYATWHEEYPPYNTNHHLLRVKEYNPSTGVWQFIDGGALNISATNSGGMNTSVTQSAIHPGIVSDGTSLFLAWQESNGTKSQIYVSRWNGTTWTRIDGGSLNTITTEDADYPSITVMGGMPYVAFNQYNLDDSGFNLFVRVKKYESGAWTLVDGSADRLKAGLPWAAITKTQDGVRIHGSGSLLNLAFKDNINYNGHWASLSGSTWAFDPGGTPLILDVTQPSSAAPDVCTNGTDSFVVFNQGDGSVGQKIYVKKRKADGSWVRIDGGTSNGISITSAQGQFPRILCHGNYIYVTWYEDNGSTSKIVARKFLTTTPTVTASLEGWTTLNSAGLNSNQDAASGAVDRPAIANLGDNIYVFWEEITAGSGDQPRLIKMAQIE